MIRRTLCLTLAVFLLARPGSARAQTASEVAAQGMSAYRSLEYDAAIGLLRRALSTPGVELSDSARAAAGIYLGASELFRGRRDAAAVAFRQALATDPRRRPDRLVFPPAIVSAFDSVRFATAFVHARTPAPMTIPAGTSGAYPVTFFASAPHTVTVDLVTEQGAAIRSLYSGPIGDSLEVRWDGLDAAGGRAVQGRVALQIASRGTGARRVVRVPLTIALDSPDTVPYPPPPVAATQPAGAGGGRAVANLAVGALAGLAAVTLPSVIGVGGEGLPARYAIGGALGIAGIVGFVREGPSRARALTRADQDARDAWQRNVATLRVQNAQRRREAKLRVTAGPEMVITTGEP